MRKKNGFSLIELLIVVAIILIIAAIAVPNLMRARVSADESSAVGSLRSINSAEVSYSAAYSNVGFTATLANLGGPAGAACVPSTSSGCFIDSSLSGGTKSGYAFALAAGSCAAATPANCYSVVGTPQFPNISGIRSFCSFEDAVVRSSSGSIATCTAAVSAVQ